MCSQCVPIYLEVVISEFLAIIRNASQESEFQIGRSESRRNLDNSELEIQYDHQLATWSVFSVMKKSYQHLHTCCFCALSHDYNYC